MVAKRSLSLQMLCNCVVELVREGADEHFVVSRVQAGQGCTLHPAGVAGRRVKGFGPYPVWDANRMLRVWSVPEAGGVMEGEHAFILDEQFLFIEGQPQPKPVGPIRRAAWQSVDVAAH